MMWTPQGKEIFIKEKSKDKQTTANVQFVQYPHSLFLFEAACCLYCYM